MNSFWNKNIALFCSRFPSLAEQQGISKNTPEPADTPFEIATARNGSVIAREQGKFLHSQYNPEREAEQTVQAAKKNGGNTCVFLSCGLGYAPNTCAGLFPEDTLIVVEPNPAYFFAALRHVDWTNVFSAKQCVIILNAPPETVITLIQNAGGFAKCGFVANNNQMEHAAAYFSVLSREIEDAKQQTKINENTYKRFYDLWLRNSRRNIRELAERDGIACFKGSCPATLPAVILAAGPTLDEALPHLGEMHRRALTVCVDTALHTCLRAGVEPDFIVLTDPQYHAARHIAGLEALHSILITETAVYPSVYHFPCKEILLCSSFFPPALAIERQSGLKGALSSGGSVSTTAWEFARYIGARQIYFAGLDLGYPGLQTHIRGSTFEEKIHTVSNRTHPAETAGVGILFGANMLIDRDYDGNAILTDNRMKMFASWFEGKMKEYPQVSTFTLSAKSLAIAGINPAPLNQVLSLPEASSEKEQFFAHRKNLPRVDSQTLEKIFKNSSDF